MVPASLNMHLVIFTKVSSRMTPVMGLGSSPITMGIFSMENLSWTKSMGTGNINSKMGRSTKVISATTNGKLSNKFLH